MRVYRFVNDVKHYQYFLTEQEEDWEKLALDCTPVAGAWEPPAVYIYRPTHRRGDFFHYGDGTPILSPRATDVLATYLEMAGELLPLPHGDETFTVLNVTECINCLDQEHTEWEYAETGERLGIKKYAFHPRRFSESPIFKIPETRKVDVLILDRYDDGAESVKHFLERSGLQGYILQELWSDEGTGS
jgi:hypothetical protein